MNTKIPFYYSFVFILFLCLIGNISSASASIGSTTANSNQTVHFIFTQTTGSNATVALSISSNPALDGIPIVSGDEIGIFSPADLCIGAVVWYGLNTHITVWGDNPMTPAVDGLAIGEQMHYRLWKQSTGLEYINTEVVYSSGNGIYDDNALYAVSSFNAWTNPQASDSIALAPGWNMISSYVQPNNTLLDSVFQAVVSNIVIVKDNAGKVYWPSLDIKILTNWNSVEGYQVNMNIGSTLVMKGSIIRPEATPVVLSPGWHITGYHRFSSLAAEQAFASIDGNFVIIKNNLGDVYWPQYAINTIGSVHPGQGYMIDMSATDTLSYPANTTLAPKMTQDNSTKQIPLSKSLATSHFQPINTVTGANATFLMRMHGAKNGDEIALRTQRGDAVGAGVIKDGQAPITAWGDNSMTREVVDGAIEGESLLITHWSASENKERSLRVSNLRDGLTGAVRHSNLTYRTNTVEIADLEFGASELQVDESIPTAFVLKQNYPNPFNPATVISFGLPYSAQVRIDVFNLMGEKVAVLWNGVKSAGHHTITFDASGFATGIYYYRMTAGQYVDIKKMILIK